MFRSLHPFLFGALSLLPWVPAITATRNIGSQGEELLLLDNGTVKVGIDRAKGAAITWLSWTAYPRNMVNVAPVDRVNLGPKSTYRYRYWLIVGAETPLAARLDTLAHQYRGERAELTNP